MARTKQTSRREVGVMESEKKVNALLKKRDDSNYNEITLQIEWILGNLADKGKQLASVILDKIDPWLVSIYCEHLHGVLLEKEEEEEKALTKARSGIAQLEGKKPEERNERQNLLLESFQATVRSSKVELKELKKRIKRVDKAIERYEKLEEEQKSKEPASYSVYRNSKDAQDMRDEGKAEKAKRKEKEREERHVQSEEQRPSNDEEERKHSEEDDIDQQEDIVQQEEPPRGERMSYGDIPSDVENVLDDHVGPDGEYEPSEECSKAGRDLRSCRTVKFWFYKRMLLKALGEDDEVDGESQLEREDRKKREIRERTRENTLKRKREKEKERRDRLRESREQP
jgi:hypothetical protein